MLRIGGVGHTLAGNAFGVATMGCGCTNSTAYNYDALAMVDDYSCVADSAANC